MTNGGEEKKELLSTASGSEGEKQLIQKIREEVNKKGAHLNKFLEMVESFADDIPDPAKRYGAALKAMSHAAGLKKEDILASADERIEELKNQRLEMAASVAARKSELALRSKKAQELRNQINLLQESIKRIEDEEREILVSVATGETEIKTIENRLDSVIQTIEKEIIAIKEKIDSNLSKPAAVEASLPAGETKAATASPETALESEKPETKPAPEEPAEGEEITEEEPKEKVEGEEAGVRSPMDEREEKKDAKQKPCPVCSNPMDWYSFDSHWKCFVCGHEEE